MKLKTSVFYYIVALFFLSGNISCVKKDWYEVKSDKSLQIPSTLKDMQALMDASHNSGAPTAPEFATDCHYLTDQRITTLTPAQLDVYTWSYENEITFDNDWTAAYLKIYYCNLVLDGIEKIKISSPDKQKEKDNIKGIAYFIRGKSFYQLAQKFAPHYEPANASSKLGIPLRLEADVNIPSKRSNLKETYTQIFSDLEKATQLLPDVAGYSSRPNKVAAYAVLARIHLSIEDYEASEKYAELVLEKKFNLLDYNTLATQGSTNPFLTYVPEIIYLEYLNLNFQPLRFTDFYIKKDFYDTYSENDARKYTYFYLNPATGLISYKGSYATYSYLFHGLATDEIYLIRAECYARRGNIIGAMKDINDLLKMRWSPDATVPARAYVDKVAADKDEALEIVLEERKKELVLRGVRWSDLRRLNKDPRFQQTFTKTINGKTYTLEPNSYKYTFPIPDDVLNRSDMKQNEGWEK